MGLVAPQHVGSSVPGIEPVSSALADRFFITEPPGNPKVHLFFKKIVLPV